MKTTETTDSIVIIPAYNPPNEALLGLVQELIQLGVEKIVIVNDGSDKSKDALFEKLEQKVNCVVIRHAVNLGKGRALKTAFNFVLGEYPNTSFVVTADADSQHKPEDIAKIILESQSQKDTFTIGVRRFDRDVPFRSKFGNILTKHIFRLLIGMRISDTQSGLRSIPFSLLPHFLRISGEGYEYELATLIALRDFKIKFREVPIGTVYLNNNESSKFNPFIDSMKIYFVLFRFMFSSLTSAVLDFLVFMLAFFLTDSVLISLIISRTAVSVVNYFVNLKLVFKRVRNTGFFMFKYYLLLGFIAALSYLLISLFHSYDIPVAASKIIAETTLFVVSFTLQRDYVFSNSKTEMENGKN